MARRKSKSKKAKKTKMKLQVLNIDANGNSVLNPALERRRSTLKNKAYELSKLCDVTVHVITVGPDGKAGTWPENQEDVKATLRKYKNNLRGLKDEIRKDSFSAGNGFLEIANDRVIDDDAGFDNGCLESKLDALNERIGVVTRKMRRDDGTKSTSTRPTCTFMEFYRSIMTSAVVPDMHAADRQQSIMLDQFHQQEEYCSSIPYIDPDDYYCSSNYNGFKFDECEPNIDTIDDYLSWLLGDYNDTGFDGNMDMQFYDHLYKI